MSETGAPSRKGAGGRGRVVVRLVAEFLVIVTGVLVALAVDQWRVERDEAALEREYAERLRAAFVADTTRISGYLEGRLEAKKEILLRLAEGRELPVDRPEWTGFALTATFDRGIPDVRAETFREMEAAGNLGLLDSAELRDLLGAYYAWHDLAGRAFDDSWSDFAAVASERIPGSFWYEAREAGPTEESLRSATEGLVGAPEVVRAANAELAYTANVERVTVELLRRARDVLERLDAEYGAVRTPR